MNIHIKDLGGLLIGILLSTCMVIVILAARNCCWEHVTETQKGLAKRSLVIIWILSLLLAYSEAARLYKIPHEFGVQTNFVGDLSNCFLFYAPVLVIITNGLCHSWSRRRSVDVTHAALFAFIAISAITLGACSWIGPMAIIILVIDSAPRSRAPAELLSTVNLCILASFFFLDSGTTFICASVLLIAEAAAVHEVKSWSDGTEAPSAEGATAVSVLTMVLSFVFSMVLLVKGGTVSECLQYILSFFCIAARLVLLQREQDIRFGSDELRQSFESDKNKGLLEAVRHLERDVVVGNVETNDGAAKSFFEKMKKDASLIMEAMGSWHVQMTMALSTSTYSGISMALYLWKAPRSKDNAFENMLTDRDAALIALTVSFLLVSTCTMSLLKFYGYPVPAADRNFKVVTVMKSILITSKLILNFQVPKNTPSLIHDMVFSASWLSLLIQIMLTLKTSLGGEADGALKSKVKKPAKLKMLYVATWLCTKGGLTCLTIGSCYDIKNVLVQGGFLKSVMMGNETLVSMGLVVISSFTLALGSIMTNELSRMMENPTKKFTAALSGDGARALVAVLGITASPVMVVAVILISTGSSFGWALNAALISVIGLFVCYSGLGSQLGNSDVYRAAPNPSGSC